MNFYKKQHKYYCGIDLHTRVMYVCITDDRGNILVHKNLKTDPAAFIDLIQPYREDLVSSSRMCICLVLASGSLPAA